jgi:hypothetical protein
MHHRCTDGSISSEVRLFVSPPFVWRERTPVLALCFLLFRFSPSQAVADCSAPVVSVLDGDTSKSWPTTTLGVSASAASTVLKKAKPGDQVKTNS